jgi:DegT/DnrJ/EryC1/StrS aminotransferase family
VTSEKKIDVLEDCAQSFAGVKNFNGTEGAKLTMFSLGMIKVQTCFSGGVGVVRNDDELFEKMYALQKKYALFEKKLFLKKIMTGLGLMTFMNKRSVMMSMIRFTDYAKMDREEFMVSLVRYAY